MALTETYKKRQDRSRELLALLQDRQPAIFNEASPKPMKIGIHLDFYQIFPEFSKTESRRFFQWWTKRKVYQTALKEAWQSDGPRFDLWGNTSPFNPDRDSK